MRFSYLIWTCVLLNTHILLAKDRSDHNGMLEYVQELTGKIDTLEKKLEDFERRLQTLEEKSHKKAIAEKSPLKPLPVADQQPKEGLRKSPPNGGPDNLWKEALCAIQQKRVEEAKQKFIDFEHFYPEHPNVPEGRYWLGEIQFAAENYSQAQAFYALAYKGFTDTNPRKTEVGVKLADCYFALNKNKEGCVFLKEVMQLQQKGAAITPATVRLLEQLWFKHKCADKL